MKSWASLTSGPRFMVLVDIPIWAASTCLNLDGKSEDIFRINGASVNVILDPESEPTIDLTRNNENIIAKMIPTISQTFSPFFLRVCRSGS